MVHPVYPGWSSIGMGIMVEVCLKLTAQLSSAMLLKHDDGGIFRILFARFFSRRSLAAALLETFGLPLAEGLDPFQGGAALRGRSQEGRPFHVQPDVAVGLG